MKCRCWVKSGLTHRSKQQFYSITSSARASHIGGSVLALYRQPWRCVCVVDDRGQDRAGSEDDSEPKALLQTLRRIRACQNLIISDFVKVIFAEMIGALPNCQTENCSA